MRLTATLILLAAIVLGQVAPIHAYTVQYTSSTANLQIRWPVTTISVALSTSLNAPPSNIKAGSDVVGAARRALRRWEEASNIRFNITTSSNEAATSDGVNLITVSPVNGSLFSSPNRTGRARVFFDPATGFISEADVAINPTPSFSTDGTFGTYDLETTFTHEIGHMLGLEHSGIVGAIMQPRQGTNGTYALPAIRRRTLADDDRAGIRSVYGPRNGLGALAGTVTTPGGATVFGAHIWVEEVSTGRVMASNISLPNGSYRIDALPPGQYRVMTETLNEPVSAAEIASTAGAYQGISTQPPLRTFEAGTVTINENAVTSFNVALPDALQPILNPRIIGTNGQLSSVGVPIVPGTTVNLLVGGDNMSGVSARGVSITSPYFTVDPNSVQQLNFGVEIISFNATVSSIAAPGDYSVRLASTSGEVAYLTGGLSIALPNGTTATSPNPIDDTQFFVAQQYRDFLNREPDASGLQFWTREIESCGTDTACRQSKRVNVSAAFFLSIEFQQTGYLVYRIHKAAFGNLPGKPVPVAFQDFLPETQQIGRGVVVGAQGWEQQLEANKQAFLNGFVNRADFLAQYPLTLSPAQFVDSLNRNAGGVLTQSERDALVSGLQTGAQTRATVLRSISENATLSQREFNPAFVLMQYFGYLRRNPDDLPDSDFSGYNFWLSKLNQFGGNYVNAEMVSAFINATEYRTRFGSS